jgi:hypothetical protein
MTSLLALKNGKTIFVEVSSGQMVTLVGPFEDQGRMRSRITGVITPGQPSAKRLTPETDLF